MKFAHDFKDALSREGYPPHWVESAIPYSQLKKVLKRVARELSDLGLDPETLRQLLNLDPDTDSPLALKYGLKAAGDSEFLRPKLTVLLHLDNGIAVDASLSPASRTFLERVALLQPISSEQVTFLKATETSLVQSSARGSYAGSDTSSNQSEGPIEVAPSTLNSGFEKIEVPLTFDSEFFDMLQNDVSSLDVLQAREEKAMITEIVSLGHEVSQLAKPSRISKNDLARWRAIFELYLEAQIFFSTYEQDHGARDSQTAAQKLRWFQGEVAKRNLANQFKMAESRQALVRFLNLNTLLLKNVQFQEINRTAITKILKKFDKRTSLGVSKTFPVQVRSEKLMAGTMARDICARVSSELVSQVPQLSDYLCPVCFTIAYRPVRLACQHVFCIRCIVKIQRRREQQCPLCRADVVMTASADNLDMELDRWMRRYFKKEVHEKAIANDTERGIEEYGPGYTQKDCIVM